MYGIDDFRTTGKSQLNLNRDVERSHFSASFLFSLNFWPVFVPFFKMQYLKIRLSWVMTNSLQLIFLMRFKFNLR
jgi:hypothetical protein